jgi:hypothetical protein
LGLVVLAAPIYFILVFLFGGFTRADILYIMKSFQKKQPVDNEDILSEEVINQSA